MLVLKARFLTANKRTHLKWSIVGKSKSMRPKRGKLCRGRARQGWRELSCIFRWFAPLIYHCQKPPSLPLELSMYDDGGNRCPSSSSTSSFPSLLLRWWWVLETLDMLPKIFECVVDLIRRCGRSCVCMVDIACGSEWCAWCSGRSNVFWLYGRFFMLC
jgi:hypothetical protein